MMTKLSYDFNNLKQKRGEIMIEIIRVVDNFNDKCIKEKNIDQFNAYLRFLNIDIQVKMFLKTEITGIEIGQNISDAIALTADGELCIFEVETNKPSDYAIAKEFNYGTALLKNFDKVKDNI